MSEIDIEWPWQYSFPPFFTLQPHPETRSKQVAAWKSLILDYCKKNKVCIVDIREADQLPLFNNSAINRKLESGVIVSILGELQKTGNAAAVDKSKNRWEIYWHTLEEWGSIIHDYVTSNGLTNSVMTLFELNQGESQEEFHGLHTDVLIKALKTLEEQRKCELILSDEDQGVKFF
ncbi:unnamed protein product [Brassicogethes aeneus]|uniref:Vacuolar protein-sorting-associated protein 25 n=1 Tax=Brassicogethes aeneus TaxID=1431903 RepID=A0A9P0AYU3_BRAAE|nr:unnamed protein product [Brassicogethes aeneus]